MVAFAQYFTDQNGPKVGTHNSLHMNIDYFQIKKWMLPTDRVEKVDEENRVICLVSMFTSWVMVLKFSKKVDFLQVCADFSKKPKPVKTVYIYASESSYCTDWENDMIYRGLRY